jgi:hypothetical protein
MPLSYEVEPGSATRTAWSGEPADPARCFADRYQIAGGELDFAPPPWIFDYWPPA